MAVATTTCTEHTCGSITFILRELLSCTERNDKPRSTYNDDLYRNGERQFVAVVCTQLLHNNQHYTADQSKY